MKASTCLFVIVTLFLSLQLSAQESESGRSGYYTFGLDAGWSYQSSDVRSSLRGWGSSLSFGRSIFYRPGAWLGLELRARLLYAQQYGLDHTPSLDIQNNEALNGSGLLDYTSYPANLEIPAGFVFQNHKTEVGELSLEALLQLNKLREQTNILVALYGGIGIDWYYTRLDQADILGTPYYEGYASLIPESSNRQIRKRLRQDILDGNFETPAETFSDPGKFDLMPSLGIELGYQFTPGFALVGGHRTTFSGTNLLDGHQWEDSRQDLYHYTHLGLRWKFWQNRKTRGREPRITILLPSTNPTPMRDFSAFVRARIDHVSSPADVELLVNGIPQTFDFAQGIFLSNVSLRNGRNEVLIQASNPYGTDREKLIFLLQGTAPVSPGSPSTTYGDEPRIRFITPPGNRLVTQQEGISVRAEIDFVSNKNDIEFLVNGKRIYNFLFDAARSEFIASIPLVPGSNDLSLRAENAYGSDLARATIIRERADRLMPPDVSIIQPSSDPFTTSNQVISIRASITQIRSPQQISLTVNGRNITSFDYQNGNLQANISLSQGRNDIQVKAVNETGTDAEKVVVIREQSLPPPSVRFVAPSSSNSTVREPYYELEARLDHVSRRNDVQLKHNGQLLTTFTFTPSSGQLTDRIRLKEGNNTLFIRATNASGKDEASVNIRFVPGEEPTVHFLNPKDNSQTSESSTGMEARVSNVRNRNDIQLILNGRPSTRFTYTPRTGMVKANLPLRVGSNSIRLIAQNAFGEDRDEVSVSRISKRPPKVTILQPENGAKVSKPAIRLIGSIEEVTDKRDIGLTLNGKTITDFSWDPGKDELSTNLRLREGSNSILIRATNEDGDDQDAISVIYQRTGPKPEVTFTDPARPGQQAKENPVSITASIAHVASASDIVLRINGKPSRAFTFQQKSDRLIASVSLKEGLNELSIKATNEFGEDEASSTLRWKKPAQFNLPAPVISNVSITTPAPNPLNPNIALAKAEGKVTGITRADQFSATLNGQSIPVQNLSLKSGDFSIDLKLEQGNNTLILEATNDSGTDRVEKKVEF